MSESFTIIFNSRGTKAVNNSNLNAVVYNVIWAAILPVKFKKFHCQFVFKSENYGGNLTNNGFASLNLGKVNVSDGYQIVPTLGIIYPVITVAGVSSYYNSTNNDNNDLQMNYPINNQPTLTLNTFAGASISNMPNYVLILTMVGIPEDA